ncbi:MAG: PTS sugar transporter subunit IIA [Calditrichaeota bacterium]|nr:PTS sugar transporter subunit IIA [Calditrichota bacterium]
MRLTEFMDSSLIALDVKARSRNEALRHLVRLAAKSAALRDPETFLREVLAREKLGTTAVGDGVAFPHARSEAVTQILVVVGRLKDGVDFGAEDGKKVRLVVLMGTPPKDIARYLKLLARFAAVMRQEELRERLLHASSPADVLRAIDQADTTPEEE